MLSSLNLFFNTPKDAKAFVYLEKSPEKWILTGSRFFGGATEGSDWDFFTEYHDGLCMELERHGFIPCSVYRSLVNVSAVYKMGNFHLQLVNHARIKEIIQQHIKKNVRMSLLTHEEKKQVWHLAYSLRDLFCGYDH